MGVRSGITPAILAIWEAEAKGSGEQSQPQLRHELKAGLGHIVDPVLAELSGGIWLCDWLWLAFLHSFNHKTIQGCSGTVRIRHKPPGFSFQMLINFFHKSLYWPRIFSQLAVGVGGWQSSPNFQGWQDCSTVKGACYASLVAKVWFLTVT